MKDNYQNFMKFSWILWIKFNKHDSIIFAKPNIAFISIYFDNIDFDFNFKAAKIEKTEMRNPYSTRNNFKIK